MSDTSGVSAPIVIPVSMTILNAVS